MDGYTKIPEAPMITTYTRQNPARSLSRTIEATLIFGLQKVYYSKQVCVRSAR